MTTRDEYGDLPRYQHHELPPGDLDRIQAARTNPGPPMVERIAQEWRAQVVAEERARRADEWWNDLPEEEIP